MTAQIDRFGPEAAAQAAAIRQREATVSVRLCAPTGGVIGPVLDELLPILQEIIGVLSQDGVRAELLAVEGYHDAFYGKEADQDDPPV